MKKWFAFCFVFVLLASSVLAISSEISTNFVVDDSADVNDESALDSSFWDDYSTPLIAVVVLIVIYILFKMSNKKKVKKVKKRVKKRK